MKHFIIQGWAQISSHIFKNSPPVCNESFSVCVCVLVSVCLVCVCLIVCVFGCLLICFYMCVYFVGVCLIVCMCDGMFMCLWRCMCRYTCAWYPVIPWCLAFLSECMCMWVAMVTPRWYMRCLRLCCDSLSALVPVVGEEGSPSAPTIIKE